MKNPNLQTWIQAFTEKTPSIISGVCAYPTHSGWPPPSLHPPYFKSVPLVCGASYLTLCALWVILGNLHRVLLHSPVGPWPYASLWGSGTHLQKVRIYNYNSIELPSSFVRWWSCGGLTAITGSSTSRSNNCSRVHCSIFSILCETRC